MLGTTEIIIIVAIVAVIFGAKRLPEIAKSLGKGIKEFKNASSGGPDPDEDSKVIEQKPLEKDTNEQKLGKSTSDNK
ncbi:MAG: twin-arginine translocase TatA/TatE family subunit [Spirochaetota bacterium]|nr:twin-arginine translocase TatA/TatE family subunit [Spirochaetota bacterium]